MCPTVIRHMKYVAHSKVVFVWNTRSPSTERHKSNRTAWLRKRHRWDYTAFLLSYSSCGAFSRPSWLCAVDQFGRFVHKLTAASHIFIMNPSVYLPVPLESQKPIWNVSYGTRSGGRGGQRRVNDSVREWRGSPAIHHPSHIYDVDVHCEQNSTATNFSMGGRVFAQ